MFETVIEATIEYIVEKGLCVGCGVCVDSCPNAAIRMTMNNGLMIPVINIALCAHKKKCSMCYKVCPGHEVDIQKLSNNLFNDKISQEDYYIGKYIDCYSGYSNNNSIRYHSASGGLVSQFLIFLLRKGIIQGAAITGFKKDRRYIPESYIATNEEEILSGKSSKYCPVALNGISNEIKMREGKFIIVGLPCHIHGFRKQEEMDRKFKDKILGYLSLYCSSTRTFYAQEYLFRRYSINPSELSYFAFRDDGCLGFMKTVDKLGVEKKIPYLDYYGLLRSFFKPHRCTLCIDHYGNLADVCFGDLHVDKYAEDNIGVNSIVIRNPVFNELLLKAKDEEEITLDKVTPELINKSQKNMLVYKRHHVRNFLIFEKILGRVVPKYDIALKNHNLLGSLLSFCVLHIQRQIGKRRKLWLLIDLISHLSLKQSKGI